MKVKTLVTLVIILVVLGIIGYVLFQHSSKTQHAEKLGSVLFKELRTGDISVIQIEGPEKKVTINKGESMWKVKEKFGYKADFKKIRDLLIQLKELKVGRVFEGSEHVYQRLSLLVPGKAGNEQGSPGTRIILKDGKGKIIADLIIGKVRVPEEGGLGSSGQYVRFTDSNSVYLVDQTLGSISSSPEDWLFKTIVNVQPKEIKKIECISKEGKLLFAFEKKDKNSQFKPAGPISNKQIDKGKVNRLARALSSLRFTDIMPPDTKLSSVGLGSGPYFDFQLFEGIGYEIQTGSSDSGHGKKYYLKIKAKVLNKGEESNENEEKEDQTELTKKVEEINKQMGAWIFIIPKWTYEAFEKAPDKLIKKSNGKKT